MLSLGRGPLAALAQVSPVELATAQFDDWLQQLWRAAARETSARLLLAGAREQLRDGTLVGGALRVALDDGPIDLPLREVGPFGLHRWDARASELDVRLDDPLGIASGLLEHAQLEPHERARVDAELLDSLVNLAQARAADVLRSVVARDPARVGIAADDPRICDPEHFVTDGHPWHPMTRTRVGLRPAEVLRHAADLLAHAEVGCLDVEASLVRIGGDWPAQSARWFGVGPAGFVRIPVHPTALPRLRRWFPEAFARGQIRTVAGPALPCRSLLSLRTVALAPTQQLKLACPMHTTSARRGVSPMSVHNGPLVSRLIADIQQRDPVTAPLLLMPEPAAAGLEPARVGARAGELGAILRGVPPLSEGASAWVCAAIGERWPGTDDLVLERASIGYPGGRAERLAALIDDWLALLVRPALRLYCRYGIALELHTQNTLACVSAGRLLHVRVRDLGGIRIHAPRLRRHVATPPSFAPDSFIISDDLDEVRGKLEHSLVHAHLTTLFGVAGSLGLDERRCWAAVRRMLADCHAQWQAEPGLDAEQQRELAIDFEALTRPRVRAKALLRMRLHERSCDYEYTLVDNMLARPDSEQSHARLHGQ
jgi:siderophore synthetase component